MSHEKTATQSRAVLEQAKGLLLERFKISEETAFTMLARASQTTNIKLREIANELVTTGVLRGAAAPARPVS